MLFDSYVALQTEKYSQLDPHHIFQRIALESLEPRETRRFLASLGRRISYTSADDPETARL